MVRPDSHIAWRGQAAPQDSDRLFDRLCGVARQSDTTGCDAAVVA
jgi:hypothetical protein